MRIIELFGGIGACSKALKRLGVDVEIVDYVEIDKYAVASYNAINGTNFEPQDITKWNKHFENIDLIMHGSPCQDFSLAGKQAGGDEGSGTRSSLMYETIRIVGDIKPKYVIWENVKNLLSKNHIHNFNAYLETMESLGYKNYYQVLNAKDYGIPQNRERVFTVSIRNDVEVNYKFPKKEELQNTMHDLLEENVEDKYYLSDNMKRYVLEKNTKSQFKVFRPHYAGEEKIAHTIQTSGGNRADDNFVVFEFPPKQELKLKLKDMLEDEVDEKYYLSDKQVENIKMFEKETGLGQVAQLPAFNYESDGRVYSPEGISFCLRAKEPNGKILIKNATKQGYQEAFEGDSVNLAYPNSETRRGRVGNQVSQTLQCNDSMGVVVKTIEDLEYEEWQKDKEEFARNGYKLDFEMSTGEKVQIRKLTPRETWRLMGFDDEDFEKAEKFNSNSQLYKQAGNSIVVNVLEAIFRNLLEV